MKAVSIRTTSVLGGLLLGASLGCEREEEAPPRLEPATHGTIERLHVLGPFWLASQPSEEDLRTLAEEKGIRTVVNLRTREEWPFDEEKAASSLGLRYLHLPITLDTVTAHDVERFGNLLSDPVVPPVLVHCRSANRVGALWALFRMRRGGLSLEAALEEGRAVGLSGEAMERFVLENAPISNEPDPTSPAAR